MNLFVMLSVTLTVGSLLYVFFPLLPGESAVQSSHPAASAQSRFSQQALFEGMNELDYEYKTGKLAEEDYQKQLADFAQQSASPQKSSPPAKDEP